MEHLADPLNFQLLFEAVPHPCVVLSTNSPGFPIVAASNAYLHLVDSLRDHVVGTPFLQTLPLSEASPSSAPTAVRDNVGEVEAYLARPSGATDTPFQLSLALPHHQGRQRVELRRCSVGMTAAEGQLIVVSIAGTQSSLFVPKAAAEFDKAEPACDDLRDSFRYAVPGMAILDLAGMILDCNSAFAHIVGRPIGSLYRKDSATLIHPDDRERSDEDHRRLLAGESPAFVIEKRYVQPDGEAVWVRNSVSLLRNEERKPFRIIIISEDISFSKMAEHALVQSEKLAVIGRLSASIMHEINNPLESVTNLLYLISHGENLEDIRRYSGLAEQEMRRVSEIATHTLRFYRQQSVPSALRITDVVDGVLALFEGRLRNSRVHVVRRYTDHALQLLAYTGELRQVFVNLVGNALDAMGGEGTLRVDVHPSGSWAHPGMPGVRVTISDSGSGIPRHFIKKIFEPFVSTKQDRGTGLGLWISREIIRRHGGRLSVRSSTQGARRGTVMSVFLPERQQPTDRIERAA